jgi:hypothetical protein
MTLVGTARTPGEWGQVPAQPAFRVFAWHPINRATMEANIMPKIVPTLYSSSLEKNKSLG